MTTLENFPAIELDTTDNLISEFNETTTSDDVTVTSERTTATSTSDATTLTVTTTVVSSQTSDQTTSASTSSSSPPTSSVASSSELTTSSSHLSTVTTSPVDITTEPRSSASSFRPSTITLTSDSWQTSTDGAQTTIVPPGDGLSQGAVIGIAVGASVGILIIVLLIVICTILCRKRDYKRNHDKYVDGGENVDDYAVYATTRPSNASSKRPERIENHYAVSNLDRPTNAFNNPMYAEGLQMTDDGPALEAGIGQSQYDVPLRKHSANDRETKAQSRYSMGPIMMGEDGSSAVTYDQMYKTTGTFKE